MAILECRNLCFAYEGKQVLEGVNFSLNAGDYLCVVGENGSGKSTLIKGLLGLKAPEQGSILLSDGLKATEIGYLPQQTQVQRDFPASVYEVVLSGCLNSLGNRLFYSKELKQRALENMERMGIEDLRGESYQNLSGGQQQRVLLARGEMYNLIKLINLCDNISVIMVSHDIHEAVRYATHILHLGHTQLFFGTAAEYRQSSLARRFLGGGQI